MIDRTRGFKYNNDVGYYIFIDYSCLAQNTNVIQCDKTHSYTVCIQPHSATFKTMLRELFPFLSHFSNNKPWIIVNYNHLILRIGYIF